MGFDFARSKGSPVAFSVAERELKNRKDSASTMASFRAAKTTGLPVSDWEHHRAPKLKGVPLKLERQETSRSVAIMKDLSGFIHGAEWNLRAFSAKGVERWKLPSPGPAWAVNLAARDQLAVAAYGDGTIRWHRADTGQELLAFYPHADKERWVLWTPEGYYDCSAKGEELIGWHVNRGQDQAADFFPASQFRKQFYRPDVIARVLTAMSVEKALKEANAEGGGQNTPAPASPEVIIAKLQPPVLELAMSGGATSLEVEGTTATVRYRVRSAGEPATRVRLLVDGRPIPGTAPLPEDNGTVEARIPVPQRECILTLLAENQYAVSSPVTLRLMSKAGAAEEAAPSATTVDALKPKLYLVAAGISDYQHNDQLQDLQFAAKDARDFAAAFKAQEGGLYSKVEATVLTDQEATAGNILDALEALRRQTTARDVAVIFLSGHGENDEQRQYFFCPHDYDKTRRMRTGVSHDAIQKTVRGLAGKVLFFVDSCHAGNALGKMFAAKSTSSGLDVTQLVNDLAGAENGAVVFTSSTGRQLSMELTDEKNGAFTKAIVEGLNGGADLLRKGSITVSTLEAFIANRVKELTNGEQSPTVAKPETVPDFPVAIRR